MATSNFPSSVDTFALLYDGQDTSSLVNADRWNTLSDALYKMQYKLLGDSTSGGSHLVRSISKEYAVGYSEYTQYRQWSRLFKASTTLSVPSTTGIANFSWNISYTNKLGAPVAGTLSEIPSILGLFFTVESSGAQSYPYSINLRTWSRTRPGGSTTTETLTLNLSLKSSQIWNPAAASVPANTYYIKAFGTTVVLSI